MSNPFELVDEFGYEERRRSLNEAVRNYGGGQVADPVESVLFGMLGFPRRTTEELQKAATPEVRDTRREIARRVIEESNRLARLEGGQQFQILD